MKMESKEYFEKVIQDYNEHRNGRSLRKYCKDEAIDYDGVIKFKKTYPVNQQKRKVLNSRPTDMRKGCEGLADFCSPNLRRARNAMRYPVRY